MQEEPEDMHTKFPNLIEGTYLVMIMRLLSIP